MASGGAGQASRPACCWGRPRPRFHGSWGVFTRFHAARYARKPTLGVALRAAGCARLCAGLWPHRDGLALGFSLQSGEHKSGGSPGGLLACKSLARFTRSSIVLIVGEIQTAWRCRRCANGGASSDACGMTPQLTEMPNALKSTRHIFFEKAVLSQLCEFRAK